MTAHQLIYAWLTSTSDTPVPATTHTSGLSTEYHVNGAIYISYTKVPMYILTVSHRVLTSAYMRHAHTKEYLYWVDEIRQALEAKRALDGELTSNR